MSCLTPPIRTGTYPPCMRGTGVSIAGRRLAGAGRAWPSASDGDADTQSADQHDHADSHHSHDSHDSHAHAHSHAHAPEGLGAPRHAFSWVGLALGLSLHTLIDGMALAAGVLAGAFEQTGWGLFGLGTFLAVVLHKPLDAMSITVLMGAAGWSHARQRLVNYAFAPIPDKSG